MEIKIRSSCCANAGHCIAGVCFGIGEEINHLKQENAEMKQMLMQMQEQLQEVMMKTNAMQQQAKKAAEGADKKGGMVKSKKEDITISTTGGGIKVKSSKGNQFKIGGRLMYDYDSYDDFWER